MRAPVPGSAPGRVAVGAAGRTGLHDNRPGPLAAQLTWLEGASGKVRGRSCGKLAAGTGSSSQWIWGPLGSPNDCSVSQPLPRMEWAGKHPDFQVRAPLSRSHFPPFPGPTLGCLCLYCPLGARGSRMMSCSNSWIRLAPRRKRRREAANFS